MDLHHLSSESAFQNSGVFFSESLKTKIPAALRRTGLYFFPKAGKEGMNIMMDIYSVSEFHHELNPEKVKTNPCNIPWRNHQSAARFQSMRVFDPASFQRKIRILLLILHSMGSPPDLSCFPATSSFFFTTNGQINAQTIPSSSRTRVFLSTLPIRTDS
jgi:hypothetical protein